MAFADPPGMANSLGYKRLQVIGEEGSPENARMPVDGRQDRYGEVSIINVNPWSGRPIGVSDALVAPNQPDGSIVAGKSQERMTPDVTAYQRNTFIPADPGNPAVAAIDKAAPLGTGAIMFPVNMPAIKGTPNNSNYTAAMRFASRPPDKTGPLQLSFEPGDKFGARISSEVGRPVVSPSGKIYGSSPAPVMIRGSGTTPSAGGPGSNIPTTVRDALQAQAQASLTPAGGFQPVTAPGQATDVHGNDLAFMPQSVQTSARQRTGY